MLNLIIGPMKAGKTDNIVRIYNKYTSINKKVIIINHIYDENRIGKFNVIRTHNNLYLEALSTNSLLKVLEKKEYKNAEIVIIDESQFFVDLIPFIEDQMIYSKKTFYVYGLSGDINQKKIGNTLDLIPLCDTITHLTALCSDCKDGTFAPFTKIKDEYKHLINNQLFIGDTQYKPVCRKHCFPEKN